MEPKLVEEQVPANDMDWALKVEAQINGLTEALRVQKELTNQLTSLTGTMAIELVREQKFSKKLLNVHRCSHAQMSQKNMRLRQKLDRQTTEILSMVQTIEELRDGEFADSNWPVVNVLISPYVEKLARLRLESEE